MDKQKNKSISIAEKFSKLSIALALIGVVLFLLLIITAILAYGNYDMLSQYLSELGVSENGILFNLALVSFAIFAIPFFLIRIKGASFVNQTACILAAASLVFLAGVGVYTLNFRIEHYFSAMMFFFASALAMIAFCLEEVRKIFEKKEKINYWVLGFILLGFFSAGMNFYYMILFRNPLGQKLSVLFITLWILAKILKARKE